MGGHVRGWIASRHRLERQRGSRAGLGGLCGEYAAANQAAQCVGQRRHVDGEPVAFQQTESERQACQHRLGLQQLQHWKAGVTERHIALSDDLAMLGLTMDLAETLALPMSVVWAAIRNWIDQGLV